MSSDPNLPPNYERDPSLPPEQPVTELGPGPNPETTSGLDPNLAAGLSLVVLFVTGAVFLALERKNRFVRYWAMQAVFYGVAVVVVMVVASVISAVLIPIPLIGWLWIFLMRLLALAGTLIWLFMMFKAFTGKTWELPVLGQLARAQLERPPQR